MIRRCLLFVFISFAIISAASAAVTRVVITEREPYEQGKVIEGIGSYEWIRGRVEFAIDPAAAANATVVDLEFAPTNDAGLVEFSADLEILAPVDLSKSNGAILYDVNNRGNRVCLGQFNGGGGDDFLLRQGFIVVWSGWIAELLPGGGRLLLDAPIATEDGRPITGMVRAEFVSDYPADRYQISHFGNHGSYPPTEKGLAEAVLTWRLNEADPRVVIPRSQWKLHREYVEADGRRSLLPKSEIEIAGGIQAGFIYELVYEAHGPIVQGLGLAGIRDLISHFKHAESEQNPLRVDGKAVARFAYGFGVSQSGRCLRQLLYDGFNADEQGRIVFDGVIPHVAGGGRGFFNHRFASPTRHNTQHDNHLYPADVFPFTYGQSRDPFTAREDGILARAQVAGTCPKVMHVQSSSEYWHRAGSLVHTDPEGKHDAEIPDGVRIYAIGGAQHGPGSGRVQEGGTGQLPRNPTDYRPVMRGLLMALVAWVQDETAPPANVYPKLADGTLANWSAEDSGWRALPGIRYPTVIHAPAFVNRGDDFLTKRRATIQPPLRIGTYGVRVPAYGDDDNERGCLLLPTVAVPVATLTSWNLRSREIGAETELLSLAGGYIPLPANREVREQSGDPRLSLAERYAGFDDYFAKYQAHVSRSIEDRYILEEDRPRLEQLAREQRGLFEE
ncbi:MAG: alpha/beta hydrolase domain-containing protein [Planctomycetota bacterium]|nr:alpha/beta hydrolase domain-containing protein [Planctomycetota bacterium]